MSDLTQEQITEYYHRSYKTVDGLWFVKAEEKFGFETAMEIDTEVWKVIPKIQARLLQQMLNLDKGMEALKECFSKKLELDGFKFNTEPLPDNSGFLVKISSCPWYELRVKSGRENLFKGYDDRICSTEFKVFAKEFGEKITFGYQIQLCKGGECCILQFSQ
ncbi:MAG: DUF6125 family protein [bacterium]